MDGDLTEAGLNEAVAPHPIDLKRGIELAIEAVAADLQNNSKKVTSNEEIVQVATISANGDAEIGKLLADAMKRVGNEDGDTRWPFSETQT